jgi:2'-5' RNA ligase
MQTIRSFIAIPLADHISRRVKRLLVQLKQDDDGIKWVPIDNLHLTLKFLGDVDNTQIPKICDLVREICVGYERFELEFAGTGGFPKLEKPRVLFVGVNDPTGSLVRIVGELEDELSDLGFKPEPRDYTPHLTIGRTRRSGRRAGEQTIARLKSQQSCLMGEMTVDKIHLMASFLDKGGPTYQVMDTISVG